MTVHVLQGGIEFTGEVEQSDKVSHPSGTVEARLVVAQPNGLKTFVYPDRPDVSVTEIHTPPEVLTGGPTPLSSRPGDPPIHPVGSRVPDFDPPTPPPPSLHAQPAVGTSIAGVALTPTHAPPEAGLVRPLPPSPLLNDNTPRPPPPSRFIVQSAKGKPKVFHTRSDCPRVSGEAQQLPVDEDGISFFDLTVCQACERRDSQITFEEALHDAIQEAQMAGGDRTLSFDQVRKVVAKVRGWGFSISPSAVDR